MDEQSYKKLVKDINQAISDARIYDALDFIKNALINTGNIQLSSEYDGIYTDYHLMLSFMQSGGNDPHRHLIHKRIIQRVYELLDKLERAKVTSSFDSVMQCISPKTENNPEAQSINTLQDSIEKQLEDLKLINLQDDYPGKQKLIQEKEFSLYQSYASAFDFIWLKDLCNADEASNLKTFIENIADDKQQAYLISALFLNTWIFFDLHKFLVLIQFSHSEKDAVRVRAITSIVLLYIKYYQRMECYDVIQQEFKALENDKRAVSELKTLQKELFLSLETRTAEKRVREKILPELLKGKSIHQRSKMGFEDLEHVLEEAIKKEEKEYEFAQEMEEIMKMQEQGIDVNLGTFSALKYYPFFQQNLSAWFVPFNINDPIIYHLFHNEEGKVITSLLPIAESPHYCDSDRYSLLIMIQRMQKPHREFMLNEILTKLNDEYGEEDVILQLKKENSKIEIQYRLYLQNLYRFFHLNKNRKHFTNPFDLDVCLTHYPTLDYLLHSVEYNEEMIDYLMRFKRYDEAIEYLENTVKQDSITSERLEKMGYCYQKTNNTAQAIDCYQKADLLNPDNEWILNHLHICYSFMGRYQEALDCLLKLEQIDPENTKIISETGFCLLQLDRYEEAANRFYKLKYKGERVWPSIRAIAWCNFKMKKLDRAMKYYNIIIENGKDKWEDHLNYGHTLWCKGNTQEAVKFYRKYKELYAKSMQENQNVLTPFMDDCNELYAHGITKEDFALMHDIIQAF